MAESQKKETDDETASPRRRKSRRRGPQLKQTGETTVATDSPVQKERLVSLDAYRGFIMVMLAANGFGIAHLARLDASAPAWQTLDYDVWQRIAFHFNHPPWISRFGLVGVSFWDLIQPCFMFMVGVAMPYSYLKREERGDSDRSMLFHALSRSLMLVLLGVFLQSRSSDVTNWQFPNVLAQIGLGYTFAYLLLRRSFKVQVLAFVLILAGCWGAFYAYNVPADYDYAAVNASVEEGEVLEGMASHWSKNANIAHATDVTFLNWFPRPVDDPFLFNAGGYTTLNFVPSICTMLLGIMCGQLLMTSRKPSGHLAMLIAGAVICLVAGALLGETICPIVKRIWTPSWVLFSGAYTILILAAFYLLADVIGLKKLFFPLVVVGMNSLVMYMLGMLLRRPTADFLEQHFGGLLNVTFGNYLADDMYGRIIMPTLVVLTFWLIVYWMYRQRLFVRL